MEIDRTKMHGTPSRKGWRRFGAVAAVAAGLCATLAAAPGIANVDVSQNPLVLGGVMDLEGRSRALGRGMKRGIEAALEGKTVEGRPVKFIDRDDSYTPAKTARATQELLDSGVFLMMGNVGTPTAKVSLPMLADHGVPALGFFTGAGLLRPGVGDVVNYRASYAEETAAMEKSMDDTESVDSEKLAAAADDVPITPASIPSKSPSSSRKVSDTSKDESFASDAKGNGDVAEAMGAALDAVVDVIREMQADGKSVDVASGESGELIVDQDAESKDDEEWSVVKSVGSNGTTESQQIAKAAEMLGSALFNSDMKQSTEGEANGTSSVAGSSFSIPSSVPTDIGTQHAAPAQIDRWGAHLLQLRELGFENEDECVEVLERLEAANIGVDEDDDISINHVVK